MNCTSEPHTIAFTAALLAQAEAIRVTYGVDTHDGAETFRALGGWRNDASRPDHVCGARLAITAEVADAIEAITGFRPEERAGTCSPVKLTDGRFAVTMCWSQAAYDAVLAGEIEGAGILTPEQLQALLPEPEIE